MSRHSLSVTGFMASLLVLLTVFAAGCTDPNTQVNDPHSAQAPTNEYSRLPR
jgi:hypothetical protein